MTRYKPICEFYQESSDIFHFEMYGMKLNDEFLAKVRAQRRV